MHHGGYSSWRAKQIANLSGLHRSLGSDSPTLFPNTSVQKYHEGVNMGDRCNMVVDVLTRDADEFRKIVFNEGPPGDKQFLWSSYEYQDHPSETGGVVMEREEVNYGAIEELGEAARKGLVFRGHHGSGCEYNALSFAGIDGKLEMCVCDLHGNIAPIEFTEDGIPFIPQNYEDSIRAWYHANAKVAARLKEDVHGF